MYLSKITKKKIEELLGKGRRLDGRELFEYRKIDAKVNVIKKAEGSARVKFGDTEVIVGVKLGVGEPYTDSPDSGTLITTVELTPFSSEEFELGPPRIGAIELARVVDRGIRESSFIDFKKLCIKKGELVWNIFVDIYPINDDGNLIDVCALAAVLALKTAKLPKLKEKEEKIEYGTHTTKSLPLTENIPVTVTIYRIGDNFIIDPSTEEEKSSTTKLIIAISKGKSKEAHINALQKSGGALSQKEVLDMVEISIKESKKLFDIIEKIK
jgi:exosome complex component RRP42